MRVAVIVNSASGNTERVGKAIFDRLQKEGAEAVFSKLDADGIDRARHDIEAADAVALGFWCDKGSCSPVVDEVMGGLASKRVFLFGTAGFGGSPEYFDRILKGVAAKLPAEAAYAGGAMCQGKMGAGVRRRYESMLAEHPDDPKIGAMIENFDAAASHPDESDLARLASAAVSALLVD